MKIVFLGDSLTWGGYGGNFVAHVRDRLSDHDIVNAGVGGDTVVNLLRRVDDVLEKEPDGVFVMVGGNDAISTLYRQPRAYYKSTKNIEAGIVTVDEFGQAYRDLLTRIQLEYVAAWVGLPFTEYNPQFAEKLTEYNERARHIARSLSVPVLDLAAELQPDDLPQAPEITLKSLQKIGERASNGWSDYETERRRRGYTHTFDGMHLTPDAAETVADLIADFLDLD